MATTVVANDDSATTTSQKSVDIPILNNDRIDGAVPTTRQVRINITKQPDHGTVALQPSGEVTYTPDSTFTGTDTFQYNLTTGPTISGALPDGNVGQPWPGGSYTAADGTPPYTFSSRPGTTWPGQLGPMNSAGEVAAETANATGTGINVVEVEDANGLTASLTDTFTIASTSFATSVDSPLLSYTTAPYNWNTTVNVGSSVNQRLVESRNGKVFAFYANDSGAAVSSNGGGSWTSCTGLPAATRIVSLVYSNLTYIAVPESGTNVYVSTDGIAFSARTFAVDNQLISCAWAFGDTVIVARSNSSQSRRSVDGGLTWANCALVSPVQVWAIANNGDVLVAATEGDLKRSTDRGVTWAQVPGSTGAASVAYNGSFFMAIRSTGTTITSLDGLTWVAATAMPESMGSIGQGNEMLWDGENFIVAGLTHIYTSPDVVTWTQRNTIAATAIAFYRSGQ